MKFVLALVVVVAGACGTSAPNEHCNPGAEQPCTCPDGVGSVEECQNDGKWGACQCAGL